MKILISALLAAVFYPFLFLVIMLPIYVFDASYISPEDALKTIDEERVKLKIDPKVEIKLILSGENKYQTEWTSAEGPFVIRIDRRNIKKTTIRHEMFHVKRVSRFKLNSLIPHIRFKPLAQYFYVEEPLAILYEFFGINL